MKTIAFCAESFKEAAQQAAGVNPMTSPPVEQMTFDPRSLSGFDFVYIDLHGEPGQPFLYGDIGAACSAGQLRECDLRGAIVLALTCYLGDDNSPVLDALLGAGAQYVIGGGGENYSNTRSIGGADILALVLRRMLQIGVEPLRALTIAKASVNMELVKQKALAQFDRSAQRQEVIAALQDTLRFRAFERRPIGV